MAAAARELRPVEIVGLYESRREALEEELSVCRAEVRIDRYLVDTKSHRIRLQHVAAGQKLTTGCCALLAHASLTLVACVALPCHAGSQPGRAAA